MAKGGKKKPLCLYRELMRAWGENIRKRVKEESVPGLSLSSKRPKEQQLARDKLKATQLGTGVYYNNNINNNSLIIII